MLPVDTQSPFSGSGEALHGHELTEDCVLPQARSTF